jgi:prophage regulatory protein
MMKAVLLSTRQVCGITGLSRVTIWRYVKENKFPKPVKISPTRTAWVPSEIDQWVADLIAERDEVAS